MPGGYQPPFANPCAWPAWTTKCGIYAHKNPKYTAVPAYVNVTGGPADTAYQVIPDSGATPLPAPGRVLTSPCSAGVGAKNIGDPNFACNYCPPFFFGTSGAAVNNIRRPGNSFVRTGSVDLSGDCRMVGRQQAQFLRYWHGVYGFDTYLGDNVVQPGATNVCTASGSTVPCSGSTFSFSGTKYTKVEIDLKVQNNGATFWTQAYDNEGNATGITASESYSGTSEFHWTISVDPNSGVRTGGGVDTSTTQSVSQGGDVSTGWEVTLFQFADLDSIIPTTQPCVSYHDGDYYISLFGTTLPTAEFLAWLNPSTDYPAGHLGVDSTHVGLPGFTTGMTYSATLAVTPTSLLITVTMNTSGLAGPPPATGTPNTTEQFSSGSMVYTLSIQLSNINSLAMVYYDIITNLEPLWDYTNFAKHPLRADNLTTVAPLYTRRERPVAVTPWLIPDSVMNGAVGGGFAVTDETSSTGGTIPWFDDAAYVWLYPDPSPNPDLPAVAAQLELIYDGAPVDAMHPEGFGAGTVTDSTTQFQGCFDWYHIGYGGTGCPPQVQGTITPMEDADSGRTFLPPNCEKYTDNLMSCSLWPCEFVAAGTVPSDPVSGYGGAGEVVFVQRWREVQIRVPSENSCRPYGADKTQPNWSLVGCCDNEGDDDANGDAQFYLTSDCPAMTTPYTVGTLPRKYPNCPGMTFDDTPGVGGRVRVLAVDGAGVATLNVAQPYLSKDGFGVAMPSPETVNVYDLNMGLLGTAAASLGADDLHFGGFADFPQAAWISPVSKNDGSAWEWSQCDDFPKGHWVAEQYNLDVGNGGISTTGTASLQCATPVECTPTMLQAHATLPLPQTVSMAVVKQWQSSQFFEWPMVCSGGNLATNGFKLSTCNINQFVEATTGDLAGPGQMGAEDCGGAATDELTPWNIYLTCPTQFPL